MRYIKDIQTLLDDEGFWKCLAIIVDCKLYSLKNFLSSNRENMRNGKSETIRHQDIYDYMLQNSTTSNNSTNSTKRLINMLFL